jgi:hypothetical protein
VRSTGQDREVEKRHTADGEVTDRARGREAGETVAAAARRDPQRILDEGMFRLIRGYLGRGRRPST